MPQSSSAQRAAFLTNERLESTHTTRETLSGLVMVIVAAYPFLDAVVARLVDHVVVTIDIKGNDVIASQPGGGFLVRAMLMLLIAGFCFALIIISSMSSELRVSFATAYFIIGAVALLMQKEVEAHLIFIVVSLLLTMSAGAFQVTPRTMAWIGTSLAGFTTATLLYSLADTAAWQPCRLDKCTPVGMLLQGFFFHENALAVCFTLLFPTLAYVGNTLVRRFGFLTTMTCMLLSGSRSALGIVAACAIAYWFLGRLGVRKRSMVHVDLMRSRLALVIPARPLITLLSVLPLVCFLGATAFLFIAPADALSSRGSIGQVVALGLVENPIFGAGRIGLTDAYEQGKIAFLANHEHSQAGYVLNNAGLLGFSFFIMMLIQMIQRSKSWGGAQLAVMLAGPAIAGLTEPITTNDLTAIPFTVTICCLLSAAAVPPRESTTKRDAGG